MEGFWTKKETEMTSMPDGKARSCISCGLYKTATSPKMEPFGNFKKSILNIGDAPGKTEDQRGKQWQGKAGKLLQRTYSDLGIDLFEDCLNINAVNCYPTDEKGNPRAATNYEIECCRKSVLKVIEENKPKVIILLGNAALRCLIGHRWKDKFRGITTWRGWTIPDQDFNTWICPTFHPSYIERSGEGVEETIWIQDLKQAIQKIQWPCPIYTEPTIQVIDDLDILYNIKTDFAFDYETTGLKPHAAGHRIVSCAIATNENHAYAFMLPKTRKGRQPLIDLLANSTMGKIGQNIKFEETWSVYRLKQPVENWIWDTMIASHILDNRRFVTGLKFQTYVQFGVIDYSSEVAPYLKAEDEKNANAINRIMELVEKPGGKEKLLMYDGKDAVNTFRLSILQRNLILEDVLPF